jgi:uncharacterized protein (DUF58 family)
VALSGRAAAVAVASVLVVLAVRSLATVLVIDGLLLAGILVDLVLAVPVGALRVTREGDTRVRLGEPATVTTVIENTSGRRLRAQLRDAWPPSARASTARGSTARASTARAGTALASTGQATTALATTGQASLQLSAGGRGTVAVTVTPARHGDCISERVTIRSFGPLGLAARQRGQRVAWTVRALPPFHSSRHLPGKLAQLRELDGLHRTVRPGQGSEFDSLREYVIGDDVRSIDWRSTARRRDVMVRTWRPERDRRIMLVLDTGRTAAGRVAGYPRLDTAMEAAQLLTALASKAGDRVDLIAADQRIRARVLAPARTAALAAVTDALAGLQPELAETDWRLVIATILAHARRRCLVVALTDLNPAVDLLPELRALTARHELLVGSVADPRLAELADGRGDAAGVYAAAAATRAMAQRSELAVRLGRLGATVVDAPPERLPAALADAYLALKGSGRL